VADSFKSLARIKADTVEEVADLPADALLLLNQKDG